MWLQKYDVTEKYLHRVLIRYIFLIAEKDFRLCREVPARLGLRQEESLDERDGSWTSR